MDPSFHGLSTSSNVWSQSSMEDQTLSYDDRFGITYPDGDGQMNLISSFREDGCGMVHLSTNQTLLDGNVVDDSNFSDAMLQHIDRMLMQEDMDDRTHMLQESLDLQAKERSFYDVLGKKYPPSPQMGLDHGRDGGSPDVLYNSRTSSSDGSGYLIDIVDPSWTSHHRGGDAETSVVGSRQVSNSCLSSSNNSSTNVVGGISDSPVSPLQLHDVCSESQSVWNFKKGFEEASKFLPSGNTMMLRVDINGLLAKDLERQTDEAPVKTLVENGEVESSTSQSWGKKKSHTLESDLEEERSSKLPAIFADLNLPADEVDDLLLHSLGPGEKKLAAHRAELRNESSRGVKNNGQAKPTSGGKGRGKKQNKKKEVIDLRTLLITCAQAVAADDRRNSNELLKQIRQHSSPIGDGNQRLAHYFANGLEARLAGTGSSIHRALVNKKTSAADYLRAYFTFLASSPFRKMSNFSSTKTIIIKSQKAKRVHIIDFGILYGFQWPTLIQRIAQREGGPPKLRITGIDFPQPGFRPSERIEDTGRRLARYAETFNVSFEYKAIAKCWETIRVEDLEIEEDEFVAISCMYRTRNLLDETVVAESSRTKVLNLIRRINPAIFIHGIVNGAYSAPFFVTRFREVLFHFSALFDMLDNNVPRGKPERLLIERDIFGREALNVIACEGWERVERPETYKQWQVRVMKAGFMQIPFEREIMNGAIDKVRTLYHKDFLIDEDSKWMLMGWKGRIIYAISCWTPHD